MVSEPGPEAVVDDMQHSVAHEEVKEDGEQLVRLLPSWALRPSWQLQERPLSKGQQMEYSALT